jgi:biotin carboxyl carrier protein
MKYLVKLGDQVHTVLIDGESITYDGISIRARIEDLVGTPLHIVRVGDEVHRVYARRGDARGTYELSVAGHRFTAEALDERSHAIRELSGASARKPGPANVLAPMPGLIVRVTVKEGDVVRAGQGLIVMEAMKMENELRAPAAGTVRRIAVTPGNAVEKGTILLELERAP